MLFLKCVLFDLNSNCTDVTFNNNSIFGILDLLNGKMTVEHYILSHKTVFLHFFLVVWTDYVAPDELNSIQIINSVPL